jgi:hypothetical protein
VEDIRVDGRIILKRILQKYDVLVCTGLKAVVKAVVNMRVQ